MHYLIALLVLTAATANAAPVKALFGSQHFVPGQQHTVSGPLVQLQTPDGTTLSFQQGARFAVTENGTVTLTSGNLRVGPAGNQPLTINLPQGPVTIDPLTALTVTAEATQSTGRVYQGNLQTENRTFTSGQGFIIKPSRAYGTFTPAAAQAPLPLNVEPAAGPAQMPTPPVTEAQPYKPNPTAILPVAASQPATEQPATKPTTPKPDPQPEPQPPITPQPELPTKPEPQPEPETPTQPEPEPQPEAELPTPITRAGLLASFSDADLAQTAPDNAHALPGTFALNEYANGTQALEETRTGYFNLNTSRLLRGSTENLNVASNGATAGLGRWVGGELISVRGNTTSILPNFTTEGPEEDHTITPNSIHYVWGEKPTAIPTAGRVSYDLFAATQPTYTGTTQSSAGAIFNGTLAIDFTPGAGGSVGNYHVNGTVSMPQTLPTTEGPTTSTAIYTLTTAPAGIPLSGSHFHNVGSLNITATPGAIACPGTCTGTVNAAGFGTGMNTVGTLYAINPNGPVGINGAALFTAQPTSNNAP